MKRPSKYLSDIDTNGRVRRQPREVDLSPPIRAKFLDGPLAGQERDVPKGADYVRVGTWTYSWAGREGRIPLFCKLPKNRATRRAVMHMIEMRGQDPRAMYSRVRPTPVRRTAPPAAGRGARKRAENRIHAA